MEKVIIIGSPGSGKSTFGRQLKNMTGLPLYHLDMMFWNADKTTVPKEVFMERLTKTMESSKWIIDGNYGSSMEMRLKACDTVFFLDYPTEICIAGIEERKGKPRSDIPWVNDDATDEAFIAFVKNFNTESRPKVIRLLNMYTSKNIIVFHSREESGEYLRALQ